MQPDTTADTIHPGDVPAKSLTKIIADLNLSDRLDQLLRGTSYVKQALMPTIDEDKDVIDQLSGVHQSKLPAQKGSNSALHFTRPLSKRAACHCRQRDVRPLRLNNSLCCGGIYKDIKDGGFLDTSTKLSSKKIRVRKTASFRTTAEAIKISLSSRGPHFRDASMLTGTA